MAFPEELVAAILFLSCDQPAHISGAELVVNAGYALQRYRPAARLEVNGKPVVVQWALGEHANACTERLDAVFRVELFQPISTGVEAMKINYAVVFCVLFAMLSGCAQETNKPADVQAINDYNTAWDKAWNAGNAEALASLYTADAIAMAPNEPAVVGREAIRASSAKDFDQFREENRSVVQDLRISGNLAVAMGTQETKTTPKAGGDSFRDKEKWLIAFERQRDGSWKTLWEIFNSDLPVADSLPLGTDELTLMQLERDMASWSQKSDWAAFDKILAAEFASNVDGVITTKKPSLANMSSGAFKVTSAITGEMKVLVLGQTGIVHGLWIERSTLNGRDTSGTYRYTDIFAKRGGRWQRVARHANKAQ